MNNDIKQYIEQALQAFSDSDLCTASIGLLNTLGYRSEKTLDIGNSPDAFLEEFNKRDRPFRKDKALFDHWKSVEFLFQITDEELAGQSSLFISNEVNTGLLKSYLFFAVDLLGDNYARGKLTEIARQINRLFPTPVMILIKHREARQPVLSIAVINRRRSKRDAAKDVLGKVTIIRSISLSRPHRGHLDILASFAFDSLVHPQRQPINSFDTLHMAWEEVFNIELLNRRFYRELANWYFWALPQVEFPDDIEPDKDKRNATSMIRLLTRLIFCWFLKEKWLIPEKLFCVTDLKDILVNLDDDTCTYHQAILQNLFFATLNQRMGKDKLGKSFRGFAKDEGFSKNRTTYGVDTLYRYEKHFADPDMALTLFADVPFLNGGLFECLDRLEEGTNKKIYIDGFSRNRKKRPIVPNILFFSDEQRVDLSDAYGEKKRKNEKVRGLLRVLHSYKFTIVENTPIDQEIALDPELLGKVFENLLASYNEETKTTARKQTGSFYTPRPIVEYMVDVSLKAHLSGALQKIGISEDDSMTGLNILFAYTEQQHQFTETEVDALLDAIHTCKILDPACGSGAFPMGMLHKLVFVIHKLDPENAKWKQLQIDQAGNISDQSSRKAAIAAIEHDFEDNEDDYGRKLYLIENCLYGVDIQPIAIQISKLRFFISLVCDQKTNNSKKENHGIRPLPNLETRFVAADTLIGLGNDTQMQLFASPKVKKLEVELQRVRHDHFAVSTRQRKLELQKRDRELRTELARELTQTTFADQEKSRKLANWDPYDPQQSADFFEPLWMFDRSLVDGFDIVFGNPPWGAKLSRKQKILLKQLYPSIDSSTPNSFAYFVGAAMRLSRSSVAYVLPDSILVKDYGKTRKLMSKYLTHLSWYLNTGIPEQHRPFVYVEHDVCVLVLEQRQQIESCVVTKHSYDYEKNEPYTELQELNKKTFILPQHAYCYNLLITEPLHKLMEELERHSPLGEITQCHEGIHTGNSRDLLFHKGRINPQCKPLFYGGRAGDSIDNYHSNTSGWYVDYREEVIDQANGFYASLRDERIFSLPKIYITRTGNPIKAFYDLNTYASNNFFSLQFKDYSQNTPKHLKAILPLILSRLANFYIRTFAAPRLGNTYIETKIIHLKRVPVSPMLLNRSDEFASMTDLMIAGVKEKSKIQTAFLRDLIDACVLECYFHDHMAERDLLFLDDLSPHLDVLDTVSSTVKQLDLLNHLNNTLNTPDSKIRNRLLRISADSPDLLAMIRKGDKCE
jgi:hypothetical protein